MSEYINYSGGPGSIAALKPLAALSHAPTIGSNDPRRSIGNVTSSAYPVSQLSGIGCNCTALGTGENEQSLPFGAKLIFGAMAVGAVYWLYRAITIEKFDPYQSYKPNW